MYLFDNLATCGGLRMEYITCLLPGGYIDDAGQLQREVELTALSGHEEELLVTMASQGAASQVSAILSCCVKRIGNIRGVSQELMRQLLVGDRQFLMLKLRELTFGERVQATVSCPWPNCDTRVDIDFNITDIPIKAMDHVTANYQFHFAQGLATDSSDLEICFRLPNGSDQEVLSSHLAANEATALTHLLWRCIQRIGDCESPDLEQIRSLSLPLRVEIENKMQCLAPDVELTMEAQCPECHRQFTIPFDLQEFFFAELNTSRELLRREIHYLAYHYHWSEQDILNMSRDKRREYIEILADEINQINEGVQRNAFG